MAFQRKQLSADDALARLETLCAGGEYCEYELREKLRRWNVAAVDAERILAKLRRARYYDDRRYAGSYARGKMRFNMWGRRKISLGLFAKHIDADIIAEALDELDEEEYIGALTRVVRAKARSIKEGNSYEGRAKVYRSVVARGFEPGLVSRVIKDGNIWNEGEEDFSDDND